MGRAGLVVDGVTKHGVSSVSFTAEPGEVVSSRPAPALVDGTLAKVIAGLAARAAVVVTEFVPSRLSSRDHPRRA